MLRVIAAFPAILLIIGCSVSVGPNPVSDDGTLLRGGNAKIEDAREEYRVPGEYIIILRAGADAGAIRHCLSAFMPVLVRRSVTENLRLVIFRNDPGLGTLRTIVKNCDGVAGIRQNVRRGPETRD